MRGYADKTLRSISVCDTLNLLVEAPGFVDDDYGWLLTASVRSGNISYHVRVIKALDRYSST
jgi:hypothetical protein